MTLDLTTTLHTIEAIARRAGDLLLEAYHQPRRINYKGEKDLVTQADEASEQLIIAALGQSFPDHTILAEESGARDGSGSDYAWIVDPLDGTTNFTHSFPMFSVSIALQGPEQDLLLGVVYDPLRDECFTATRGGGAALNGTPIQVSGETQLAHALFGTGFAYDREDTRHNDIPSFARFLWQAQGIRRAGSAALDHAYVACGRLDGFWEQGLSPWDVAAGILLVREAGGKATDFEGNEEKAVEGSWIVASNGHLHEAMLAVLAEEDETHPQGA